MKSLMLISVFIGQFYVTSYRSVKEQTDDSPFYTANGDHVCRDGVAVSQDLLKRNGGPLDFGDLVYIEGIGIKRINDVMNSRYKNRFDVWVKTYSEEKAFDKAFHNKELAVFIVQFKEQSNERKRLLDVVK